MLVTVSGVVGSGKSTIARAVVEHLAQHGIDASVHRFQSLPCFTLLRSSLSVSTVINATTSTATTDAPLRWRDYRPRRLSFASFVVYFARIAAFQAFRATRWRGNRCHVLNRYFIDLLPHLQLTAPFERALYAVLRRAIPRPDLAILVDADTPILFDRRPEYAREYITRVAAGYRERKSDIPWLVEIRTDVGDAWKAQLEAALAPLVAAGRRSSG